MNDNKKQNWLETNQRYLMAAIDEMRKTLQAHLDRSGHSGNLIKKTKELIQGKRATEKAAPHVQPPPALETLCTLFGLSEFEKQVLLLCAGPELDTGFAQLLAGSDASGDTLRGYPTFSLAMAALPDAHWSALSPDAPLRYWRLIEIGSGQTLTLSPLRIDERILHFLTGIQYLDSRLADYLEPVTFIENLAPSQEQLAERIVTAWGGRRHDTLLPVIQLTGNEAITKRAVAATACNVLGLGLYAVSAHFLPTVQAEIQGLVRLLTREAILNATTLFLDCDGGQGLDAAKKVAIDKLIETYPGIFFLGCRDPWPLRWRPAITLEVQKPLAAEQASIWHAALGEQATGMNGHIQSLVAQFSLGAETIRRVCTAVTDEARNGKEKDRNISGLPDRLWAACRTQATAQLEDLAQRIEPAATWDDLVLPERERHILREIAIHLRQRIKVYETWGFAGKGRRGLGISALFAGASGTGKTMAAEVLANEFRLDLYRIDLSTVVSKYIGETEKNLRRVFDAAEDSGTILLFDEADALFGKRSEVKDSHDRYANIEVSYLLQRMEAYRGLAILTTNRKNALDPAFLRRIRFIVNFPFPDAGQRAEIWRRIFPAETPREGLDINRLARLNVAGGNIRNIAMNAAFLAAEENQPVRMQHLLHAARTEYAKMEKALSEAEMKGWV